MSGIVPTLMLGDWGGRGGAGSEWGNCGVSNASRLLSHYLVIDLEALAFKAENVRESSKGTIMDPRGENSRVNGAPSWLLGG